MAEFSKLNGYDVKDAQAREDIAQNTLDIEEINKYKLPHGTAEEIEEFISAKKNIGHEFYADGLYELERPIRIYEDKIYDFEGDVSTDASYNRYISRMETIKIVGVGSEEVIFKATNGNGLFEPQTESSNRYNLAFEFDNVSFVGDNYQNTPFIIPKDNSRTYRLRFNRCNFNCWNYGFQFDSSVGEQDYRGRFTNFTECYFTNNNYGLYLSQDNVTFDDCHIEYNRNKGLIIKGTSVLNFNGGKIQYNGRENLTSENGNQITIYSGSNTINFNGMYLEPTYSDNFALNNGTAPVEIIYDSSSSVLNNISFNNSRLNALQSDSLISISGNCVIYNLTINNMQMNGLWINSNKEIIKSSDTPTIISVSLSGTAMNLKNHEGTSLSNNDVIITTIANVKNVKDSLNKNIVATPLIEKGQTNIIAGSFNGAGTQKYYGGSEFTVTNEEAGKYLITLTKSNIITSNGAYFPVIATPQYSSNLLTLAIESVSTNSFRIHCRNLSGTYINSGIRFIAIINSI